MDDGLKNRGYVSLAFSKGASEMIFEILWGKGKEIGGQKGVKSPIDF